MRRETRFEGAAAVLFRTRAGSSSAMRRMISGVSGDGVSTMMFPVNSGRITFREESKAGGPTPCAPDYLYRK